MNTTLESATYEAARRRGRPAARLLRGGLWALFGVFFISVFAFWAGRQLLFDLLDYVF